MSNSRIKDLPTISPVDATLVPGDSTGTGTGKASIGAWVLAGIKSALAALTSTVTAAGAWTFSGNTTHSGAVTNSSTTHLVGAVTADATIAAAGAVSASSVTVTGALTGATATTTGLISAGGGVDFTSDKGINCADPAAAQDVSTKAYADKPGVTSLSSIVTTTDDTPTTGMTLALTNNRASHLRVRAITSKADLSAVLCLSGQTAARNVAGSASVDSGFNGGHSGGSLSAATITFSQSGGNALIIVTGIAATTLKWRIWVEVLELNPA